MKILSVCLLSLLISSGLLAADPALIDFSGKLRKNTTYSFSIRTNQTRNCEMKIPGVTRYPIRRDTQEIICSGDLFFRPDENTPGVNVYDLKLTALYGNLNSIRRDFPLLSGRTIRITVKSGKATFQLIRERNHRTMENAILGGITHSHLKQNECSVPSFPHSMILFPIIWVSNEKWNRASTFQ